MDPLSNYLVNLFWEYIYIYISTSSGNRSFEEYYPVDKAYSIETTFIINKSTTESTGSVKPVNILLFYMIFVD